MTAERGHWGERSLGLSQTDTMHTLIGHFSYEGRRKFRNSRKYARKRDEDGRDVRCYGRRASARCQSDVSRLR